MIRRLVALVCLLAGSLAAWAQAASAAAPAAGDVVVIPVRGTIDEGMAHLVQRAVADADVTHARAIVLDVNSSAGLADAAASISDTLRASRVPVDAYVERAASVGALVALSSPRIVIERGGSIGAAEPVPGDGKAVSALRAAFESLALRFHRDGRVAAAMVDPSVDLPSEHKAPGSVLTLTADAARADGIAEADVPSFDEGLAHFGLADAPRTQATYSLAEQVARVATNPEISGILLAIGFLGLLIELQTLHGIAGALGASALALFFGTHVYAGFSNGLVVAIAIVGLLLILVELHVLPGHGIAGAAGAVLLCASILLAFGVPFFVAALQALALAIVLSAVAFALLQRVLPENAFMKRLMFAGAQGADYVASADFRYLIGRSGTSASFLRPAGVATFDDVRVDVLTEGEFVPAGTPVRVTRVEGARVFVQPLQ